MIVNDITMNFLVVTPPSIYHIPTGGSTHRFCTGVPANHAAASILQLPGDWQNRPEGKCSQDDGAIRPHWNPILTNRKVRKGEIICSRRRPDNLLRYDDVKSNYSAFTKGNFNYDIREWRRQFSDLKTWVKYNIFSTKRNKSKKEWYQPQEKAGKPQ